MRRRRPREAIVHQTRQRPCHEGRHILRFRLTVIIASVLGTSDAVSRPSPSGRSLCRAVEARGPSPTKAAPKRAPNAFDITRRQAVSQRPTRCLNNVSCTARLAALRESLLPVEVSQSTPNQKASLVRDHHTHATPIPHGQTLGDAAGAVADSRSRTSDGRRSRPAESRAFASVSPLSCSRVRTGSA